LLWSALSRCSGSEIFDLYGGAHPSTNVDLLTFFGFSVLGLPTDSLSLILVLCADFNTTTDAKYKDLAIGALDRVEKFFESAPLAVDELWDEHEHTRYEFTGDQKDKEFVCEHSRIYQSAITNSGVAVTLPILSRLAVATTAQLADPVLMQRVSAAMERPRTAGQTSSHVLCVGVLLAH
jgi:hypothetical protein